jgi:transcriptional regulator with XRE-family HTH domain
MKTLGEWLEEQLKSRDWKPADLTHRAGIGSGTLSNILTGTRNPGPEVCVALARALNEPPERIFRLAGLLPSDPGVNAEEEEILYLFRQLRVEQRKLALHTLRAWVEQGE